MRFLRIDWKLLADAPPDAVSILNTVFTISVIEVIPPGDVTLKQILATIRLNKDGKDFLLKDWQVMEPMGDAAVTSGSVKIFIQSAQGPGR